MHLASSMSMYVCNVYRTENGERGNRESQRLAMSTLVTTGISFAVRASYLLNAGQGSGKSLLHLLEGKSYQTKTGSKLGIE